MSWDIPSRETLLQWGVPEKEILEFSQKLKAVWGEDPEEIWHRAREQILTPETPFAVHRRLYEYLSTWWGEHNDGIMPMWRPSQNIVNKSNIKKILKELQLNSWEEFHRWSVTHRINFWQYIIHKLDIVFDHPPHTIAEIDDVREPNWLPGARFNIVRTCFENNKKDAVAIIEGSEDGSIKQITFSELEERARRVAAGLKAMGIQKGTPVAICMPMHAESVAIYFGILWVGATVVSIADSLATPEIEKRLNIAKAKLIFTQDVIIRRGKEIPLYERIKDLDVKAIVIQKGKTQLRTHDIAYEDFLKEPYENAPVPRKPSDFINILFSSGTTGDPKAIPWTQTTPIKCGADGMIHHDIQEGNVVAWPTNLGWMMGPWLIFASFLNKGSVALFEGAPTEPEFLSFVEQARINMLGLIPSIVASWKNRGLWDQQTYDWSNIKVFSSTGEASHPIDYHWLMSRVPGYAPVIEYCGGTEIGGGYISGTIIQPAVSACFTTPCAGIDFTILDENGKPSDFGEIFVIPPSIGLSTTLLNRDHHKEYYEGTPEVNNEMVGALGTPVKDQSEGWKIKLRRHGDVMERIRGKYTFFRAHGRIDDTMNLGGIKASSVEIERVVNLDEAVSESAAIAVPPPEGGPERLILYIVPQKEIDKETLKKRLQQAIREQLNPLFKIHDIVFIDALPRTPTNKIMRRLLRKDYIEKERSSGK